jgi:two-component system, LuxR family, sensor kinase FixL
MQSRLGVGNSGRAPRVIHSGPTPRVQPVALSAKSNGKDEMDSSPLARRAAPMAYPRLFSLPLPWIGVAYIVGYVALDWISFINPFAAFGITPWNPQTGLSFVLVLLFGLRFIPLLFVAPLLADSLVRQLPLSWTIELVTVAIVGIGYSLGLVSLVRARARFNPALTSMHDLVVLLGVAAGSAAFVASAYAGILVAAAVLPDTDFVRAAIQYWVGDMIGVAVVCPFALILLTRGFFLRPTIEAAAQIAAIFAALGFVFVYAESHHFQLFYLLFLPIIWLAVRGGLEAVTIGILLTQIGLILGLQFMPKGEIDVTAFQALMLVLTMTGLIAGALVTEYRRTASQLRVHQDALARIARIGSVGELAAAVAHEINQPLMAAGTYARLVAETLRSNPTDNTLAIETAGKAAAQVERAAEVVRRLRALIRLDQSGRAPNRADRIVSDVFEISRPDLDRHHITARSIIADAIPPVMVDLLQIEQVLLNLMRNSIEAISDANEAAGTITISVSPAGEGMIAFEIRDTGPGFPADFAAGGFPPFSSSKPEGLGVGLSLCRSIVESHGGQLEVSSDRAGATVRFTLPTADISNG